MMHAIRIHVAMVELVQRMQQVINVPVSLVMWEIIVKVGIPLLLFVTDSKLYFIKLDRLPVPRTAAYPELK